MKRSTVAFFTSQDKGVSSVYVHPDLQSMVDTNPMASMSVICSLAAYFSWKFPDLPTPRQELKLITPKYNPKPYFPNVYAMLSPSYNQWLEVFCEAVNQNNAIRQGDDLYLRYEVNEEYANLLEKKGFKKNQVEGKVQWSHINPTLPTVLNLKRKEILFISCSLYTNDRPRIHLDALYIGMYFNNERWRSMNLFENGEPSNELFQSASLVIIPGSSLSVYDDKKQLKQLIKKLREVSETNKHLKILGVCFGCQMLAEIFDGKTGKADVGTHGLSDIQVIKDAVPLQKFEFLSPLVGQKVLKVSQFHQDEISVLPKNFEVVSNSPNCRYEIIASLDSRVLGIQCHPEYSAQFVHVYTLVMESHYKNNVSEEKILEVQNQKLLALDTGGFILRDVIRKFIQSCYPPENVSEM